MGFSDRRDRMTAKVVTDPRLREMATSSAGRPAPPRTAVALRRWRAGGGGGGGGGGQAAAAGVANSFGHTKRTDFQY
jgi:hypothetical protein